MKQTTTLLILFVFSIAFSTTSLADTVNHPPAALPSITVTGTGEVHNQPDMARVNIGVVTQESTAAEALNKNTESVEKLMAALKAHKIADRDIQTSNFSIYPQYDYDRSNHPPRLTGYQVMNQVRIAVRKIADLGAVLDKVVTAGANQINQVTFEIDEAESLRDTARQMAVRDAQRKAALYAKEAQVRLGPVLEVVEAGSTVPIQPFEVDAFAQQARAVPIAPGELTIREEVRVTFAIEPHH
ncbi:MAG: SIMPL domain-containing protein [Lysobacterales bacterium]|nr:MAG: SIMPL domain-containing protein [Xanthomonadales bacterium]